MCLPNSDKSLSCIFLNLSWMSVPFVQICFGVLKIKMQCSSVMIYLSESRISGSVLKNQTYEKEPLLHFTETKLCWCHVPLQQHSVSYSKSDRLWKASGTSQADQTTSPVSDQMSLLGRVQMVPASSEGKVRVTQWVKLDPSWNWLGLQVCAAPPCSSAGIISIKAHAGWTQDYNGV